MSLILDALRKLERDKPSEAGPGVVLLAPVSWPSRPRRARFWWLALAVVALCAALAATSFLLWRGRRPTPSGVPAGAGSAARSPSPAPQLPAHASPPPTLVAAAPERASAAPTPPGRGPLPARPRSSSSPTTLRLTAIGDQDGRPVAMINDRVVRVGDALEGARVVRIGASEVELERDGRRFTLTF